MPWESICKHQMLAERSGDDIFRQEELCCKLWTIIRLNMPWESICKHQMLAERLGDEICRSTTKWHRPGCNGAETLGSKFYVRRET
jgi:hypothetical protein